MESDEVEEIEEVCTLKPCPVHAPSDHHMQKWPLLVRISGIIERLCPHGVGHPDPDAVAYLEKRGPAALWGIHDCDGCCNPRQGAN